VWILVVAWPSNVAWECIKPIIREGEPLLCGAVFGNSWFDGPISVQNFYDCHPVQRELAALQLNTEFKNLRDTVGRESKTDA
jgi:hypothetical protein